MTFFKTPYIKRVHLRHLQKGQKLHTEKLSEFVNEVEYFNIETSFALWTYLNSEKIWWSETTPNQFTRLSSKEEISKFIRDLSQSPIGNEHLGICFSYYWKFTGAFVISLDLLVKNIDKILYEGDDELRIYSSKLNHIIHLIGDRTGSRNTLNELYVSGEFPGL